MLTPRQNAMLALTTASSLFVAAVHCAALAGGVCRDPDEPGHPVPVSAPLDHDDAKMPIAAPAAK